MLRTATAETQIAISKQLFYLPDLSLSFKANYCTSVNQETLYNFDDCLEKNLKLSQNA